MTTAFWRMLALSLLCRTLPCFGAAAVSLNNYDTGAPIYYMSSGTLPVGGAYVEIYGGPAPNTMEPVQSTAPGHPSVFAVDSAGLFDGGVGIVPGVADNGIAYFQVHAWIGPDGSPSGWQGQNGTPSYLGISAVFAQATGALTPPNLPSPAILNFPVGLTLIPIEPEPTTLALVLFGGAMLFAIRRWPK